MLKITDNNTLQRLGYIFGFFTIVTYVIAIGISSSTKDLDDLVKIFEWIALSFLGIAIVLLAVYYRHELKLFFTSRQARYGAHATVFTVSFIVIIGILNYISYRHHVRADLTNNKMFSLSQQTIKILKELDKEIKVTAFFVENPNISYDLQRKQQAQDMLSNYTYITNKLKVEFVDPERDPMRAYKAKITMNGSLLFETSDKKKIITSYEEQDITGAILAVTKEEENKVYFLKGHGEYDIDSGDPQKGINRIKPLLERELYKIETLNLLESETKDKITLKTTLEKGKTEAKPIPKDCSLLIIAGPEKPLLDTERKAIMDYIDRGGKLLVTLTFKTQTGIEAILAKYGIIVNNDLVIDPSQRMGGPANPAITDFPYHEITKNFVNTAVVFPLTRSIKLADNLPEGVSGSSILNSSPNSIIITNFTTHEIKIDDPKNVRGPVSVGVAVTKDIKTDKSSSDEVTKKAKIVVFGTTNFINNTFFPAGANLDLFMNTVNWLTGDEQLISIRPKQPEQKQLNLTNKDINKIFWFTIVVMPLIILLIGSIVFFKRR